MVFSKVVWFGSEGWDLMDGGGNGDGADKGDGKRNPSKRTLTGSRERRERADEKRRGNALPTGLCHHCHACHASIHG